MVATDAPLFRNTSAIRIVASARDLPHFRLGASRVARKVLASLSQSCPKIPEEE
jgi:hypothetical protein